MANIPSQIIDSLEEDRTIGLAEYQIFTTDGVIVSVVEKAKTLLKFGKRVDVGASYVTLAQLGSGQNHETYVSANSITHVASSVGGDVGAMYLEGHTVDADGRFTFVTQTVTLAGQTKTALTTPLARANRAFNNTATAWTGDIYIAEDVTFTSGVPQTASAIHLVIPAGEQQTFKAATTISDQDYYIITSGFVHVAKKTSATVDARLEIRQKGKLFLPVTMISVSTTGVNSLFVPFDPPVIVPANADVRITAVASTTAVEVSGWFNGRLAKVVG